ncbi:hypothetical protein AVEN_175692-1 [Araneus ventricosus]|uniref:Uncharacterized protein n=1 Tax=Araneus ventricosus TaxID=182803 RepID=A0A4Y2F020_ARAVE|nr:hypothetical protein AVEN_175692-1 [Araneus ventricosus]
MYPSRLVLGCKEVKRHKRKQQHVRVTDRILMKIFTPATCTCYRRCSKICPEALTQVCFRCCMESRRFWKIPDSPDSYQYARDKVFFRIKWGPHFHMIPEVEVET